MVGQVKPGNDHDNEGLTLFRYASQGRIFSAVQPLSQQYEEKITWRG
jgi:hypothetical protein